MRLVRVAGLACASVESRAWRVLLLDRTLGVCSALSVSNGFCVFVFNVSLSAYASLFA